MTQYPNTGYGIKNLDSMSILIAYKKLFQSSIMDIIDLSDFDRLCDICQELNNRFDIIFSCEEFEGSLNICREYATAVTSEDESETTFHGITEGILKFFFGKECETI